eukprot:222743-Chlamydomonas_euryale.AAC.1
MSRRRRWLDRCRLADTARRCSRAAAATTAATRCAGRCSHLPHPEGCCGRHPACRRRLRRLRASQSRRFRCAATAGAGCRAPPPTRARPCSPAPRCAPSQTARAAASPRTRTNAAT